MIFCFHCKTVNEAEFGGLKTEFPVSTSTSKFRFLTVPDNSTSCKIICQTEFH